MAIEIVGTPGDTVFVDFDVTNTGAQSGTQTITFTRENGSTVTLDELTGLTLDPSQSSSDQFIFESDPNTELTGQLCVASDNDQDCVPISLTTQATTSIEDFEDDDVTDWTNVSGSNIQTVQSTDGGASAPEGSFMSRSQVSTGTNSNNYLDISAISPTELYSVVRAENHSQVNNDLTVQWQNGSTSVIEVILDASDDGAIEVNGTVTSATAANDTFYEVYLRSIDFSSGIVGSVEVDGIEVATDVAFLNTATEVNRLRVDQTGDGTAEGYTDNHRYTQ